MSHFIEWGNERVTDSRHIAYRVVSEHRRDNRPDPEPPSSPVNVEVSRNGGVTWTRLPRRMHPLDRLGLISCCGRWPRVRNCPRVWEEWVIIRCHPESVPARRTDCTEYRCIRPCLAWSHGSTEFTAEWDPIESRWSVADSTNDYEHAPLHARALGLIALPVFLLILHWMDSSFGSTLVLAIFGAFLVACKIAGRRSRSPASRCSTCDRFRSLSTRDEAQELPTAVEQSRVESA